MPRQKRAAIPKLKFRDRYQSRISMYDQKTLELMVELKKQEVRLAELNLQLQTNTQTQIQTVDPPVGTENSARVDPSSRVDPLQRVDLSQRVEAATGTTNNTISHSATEEFAPTKFLIKLKLRCLQQQSENLNPSIEKTQYNNHFSNNEDSAANQVSLKATETMTSTRAFQTPPAATACGLRGETRVGPVCPPVPIPKLRNFGSENCDIINQTNVERLLATLNGDPDSFLLSRDLLLLIWFNPSYPENRNLKYSKTLDYTLTERSLLVYYDGSWSQVYWLTLIREYLRGMFIRLRMILDSEDVERVHKSVFSDKEEFYHNFWYTIIESNA